MMSTGKSLTKYVSVPIAAAAAVCLDFGINFQTSMQQIESTAGGSAKDVKYLSNAVLNMKGALYGPTALSGGLYHLKQPADDEYPGDERARCRPG